MHPGINSPEQLGLTLGFVLAFSTTGPYGSRPTVSWSRFRVDSAAKTSAPRGPCLVGFKSEYSHRRRKWVGKGHLMPPRRGAGEEVSRPRRTPGFRASERSLHRRAAESGKVAGPRSALQPLRLVISVSARISILNFRPARKLSTPAPSCQGQVAPVQPLSGAAIVRVTILRERENGVRNV
jgi:hypothetical protein